MSSKSFAHIWGTKHFWIPFGYLVQGVFEISRKVAERNPYGMALVLSSKWRVYGFHCSYSFSYVSMCEKLDVNVEV
jgi:hypothetical protein